MIFNAFSFKERLDILYGLLAGDLNAAANTEILVDYSVLRSLRKSGDLKRIEKQGRITLFETPKGKFFIRRASSDLTVFKQVFIKEEYEPVSILQNEDINVIVDAGANVGFTSIYFSRKFANATIYAIEPSPDNVVLLEKNIAINNLSHRIKILPVGLWSHDTQLKKSSGFRDDRDWAFQLANDEKGTIKGQTLRTIMQEHNIVQIDLLKIDVEGAEKEIFETEGIKDVLAKTKNIVIELHPEIGIQNIMQINKTLAHSGFDLFTIDETTFGIKT